MIPTIMRLQPSSDLPNLLISYFICVHSILKSHNHVSVLGERSRAPKEHSKGRIYVIGWDFVLYNRFAVVVCKDHKTGVSIPSGSNYPEMSVSDVIYNKQELEAEIEGRAILEINHREGPFGTKVKIPSFSFFRSRVIKIQILGRKERMMIKPIFSRPLGTEAGVLLGWDGSESGRTVESEDQSP
ncbi:hypothetical protein Tco_1418727 [Tanacetum coccineum]